MAGKPGRNDPCPCGSGQKYKRCCLEKDQRAQSAALADTATAQANATRALAALLREHVVDDEHDDLTAASNAVVDLVHEGKLDQAEQAARDLLERYPEVHDGYDRLGMVYEARGEPKQAADCYRKVIQFVRDHQDQYDPDFTSGFEIMVAELDPPSAT